MIQGVEESVGEEGGMGEGRGRKPIINRIREGMRVLVLVIREGERVYGVTNLGIYVCRNGSSAGGSSGTGGQAGSCRESGGPTKERQEEAGRA